MNGYNIYNWFSALSEPEKLCTLNSDYIRLLTTILSDMIVIDEISVEYKNEIIRQCMLNGTTFIRIVDNEKIIVCCGGYVGVPEPFEVFPSNYIATKPNFHFEGVPDDNETVAYILPDRLPLFLINKFASDFADVDTSLKNNVFFSRLAPIGVCSNEAQQKQFEECIEKMVSGELVNTINTPINPIKESPTPILTADISSGINADKIQYLSMYHEQLLSRFCKLFGIRYNFISKQANVIKDEVVNGEELSAILPVIILNSLKESLQKFNWNIHFNKAWEWIEHVCSEKHEDVENPVEDVEDEPEQEEPEEKEGEEDETKEA